MKQFVRFLLAAAAPLALALPAFADDQTQIGAGNAAAAATAKASPLVSSSYARIKTMVKTHITDPTIQTQTLDALFNQNACIKHRANLTASQKQTILDQLTAQGLMPATTTINGGLMAGVFPAVLKDGTACPKLPMPWYAGTGGGNGSHHNYPGGLPIHEAFNDGASIFLADNYRNMYGRPNAAGLPVTNPIGVQRPGAPDVTISQDIVVGTPLWHDWAKPMVFQFNADGTLFAELSFGGNGSTDNYGKSGDSRTGGHHIIGLAEAIARGLPAEFIVAHASAHVAPTLGNAYKVVNWLRAAAIMAQVDPVTYGILTTGSDGKLHLPAFRHLGDLDLIAAGQENILIEDPLHNLSDADFNNSIPAVSIADLVLRAEASAYGYDPTNTATYMTKFRNVAMSYLSAERIEMIYTNQGLAGVQNDLNNLRAAGAL